MSPLSIQEFCAAVYCAMTECTAFPPSVGDSLACTATSTDGNAIQQLRMEFRGVSGYSKLDGESEPAGECAEGDLLELSVIELEGESGAWRVWINPWYTNIIEFSCTSISLNGLFVEGRGHWLQDELPSTVPTLPQ